MYQSCLHACCSSLYLSRGSDPSKAKWEINNETTKLPGWKSTLSRERQVGKRSPSAAASLLPTQLSKGSEPFPFWHPPAPYSPSGKRLLQMCGDPAVDGNSTPRPLTTALWPAEQSAPSPHSLSLFASTAAVVARVSLALRWMGRKGATDKEPPPAQVEKARMRLHGLGAPENLLRLFLGRKSPLGLLGEFWRCGWMMWPILLLTAVDRGTCPRVAGKAMDDLHLEKGEMQRHVERCSQSI